MAATQPNSPEALPNFEKGGGLLPAIAQCADTSVVLMMAWMSPESFAETCETGWATYYSRSRGKLWRKGEESGHRQRVVSIHVDCDGDTILVKVQQTGAACHEGYRSCFFRQLDQGTITITEPRLAHPDQIYKKS
ncbi:MAG: phosphoribosyl-AMP cyclohydrolase [Planctomycetaceae bacterium]|nr:phosphoribosyl-AMP cyclohydrolase [Planctomycetaceae bacterium]